MVVSSMGELLLVFGIHGQCLFWGTLRMSNLVYGSGSHHRVISCLVEDTVTGGCQGGL